MSELAEFLLARVAEDEVAAQAAAVAESTDWMTARPHEHVGEKWASRPDDGMVYSADVLDRHEAMLWDDEGSDRLAPAPAVAAHIARHDPARVLREVEAKRRIVERASRLKVSLAGGQPSPFGNVSFSEGRYLDERGRDVTDEMDAWFAVDGEPQDPATLRDLALVYSDHPDYRPEWKP